MSKIVHFVEENINAINEKITSFKKNDFFNDIKIKNYLKGKLYKEISIDKQKIILLQELETVGYV